MAKGDAGKAGNTSTSWQTGSLNVDPISAEGLNSGLRNDIQASYLKGPTQTEYVGMGQGTKDAMAAMTGAANANVGLLDSAANYNRGVLSSGGLTAEQRGAMGGFQGVVDQGGFNSPMNESMDYYRSILDSSGTAPGYETLRTNAIDDARTAVNRQFGASGRFGASSHVSDLGRGITDAAAGLDYRNYEADLGRKMNAASGLFGMGQTGQGNVSGALGNIFNMGQTGQANNAAAASGLSGLYDRYLQPHQIAVGQQSALDADRQGAAAFDPNMNHISQYQGLLGSNSGAPQPPAKATGMDYLKLAGGLGGGLLSAFL